MTETTAAKDRRLTEVVAHAYAHAPAVRDIFDGAGVKPDHIRTSDDLARVPVTSKERLVELQRQRPPFGGFLGVDLADVHRVFVSPGPLYEPDAGERPGHGFAAAFGAAGIRPDDVVLNTWSYHLVPAGLMLDEGFRALGATVVPGGVGNSEVQAQAIVELGVTVIAASTAFFQTLVDRLEATGHKLPGDWKLRAAFLGGEFGDWSAKRRALEERLHITTFAAYGIGDVGLVGYECPERDGYHVPDDIVVQVCDPSTGALLPEGQPGEVVVTPLIRAYPLIRFGTGDASSLVPGPCPCGDPAPKLALLMGRTGHSIKVREIFVYPRHMDDIRSRVPGVARVQGTVSRRDGRDELDLTVEVAEGGDRSVVEQAVREACTAITRLRAGQVELVAPGTIGAEEPGLRNRREG